MVVSKESSFTFLHNGTHTEPKHGNENDRECNHGHPHGDPKQVVMSLGRDTEATGAHTYPYALWNTRKNHRGPAP